MSEPDDQDRIEYRQCRVAARRLTEASDADLLEVLAELPEPKRQRLLAALLRLHVAEVKA